MNPRNVSRLTRVAIKSSGTRSGPGGGSVALYWAMSPQTGTREIVQEREDGVEDLAADVLEVDVDAGGAGLLQSLRERRVAVVQAGVEAELFRDVPTLLLAPGDADGDSP